VCGRCARRTNKESRLAVVTVEGGYVVLKPITRISRASAERQGVPRDKPERFGLPLHETASYILSCRECGGSWRVGIKRVTQAVEQVPEGTGAYTLVHDDRNGRISLQEVSPVDFIPPDEAEQYDVRSWVHAWRARGV
jgi:hypothetical protein